MYKKKILLFMLITLVLTGCTKLTNDIDSLISEVLKTNSLSTNVVSTGYSLYIPTYISQIEDNEYNQKLKIKDRYIYLYVDIVSYYYKNTLNYSSTKDYNYFYKKIEYNGKSGYIGINKIDNDNYYCSLVYNYSKIEFYSDYNNLPFLLSNSLIIQKSIKYNDNLIKMNLENGFENGREIKYELDKPADSKSTFSNTLQEYVAGDEITETTTLPDED